MNTPEQNFYNHANQSLPDAIGKRKNDLSNHRLKLNKALVQFKDLETVRKRAAVRRWKTIENLDRYLIEFEANFIKSGGKVLWAKDILEAQSAIQEVLKKNFTKEIYCPSSPLVNELNLENKLTDEGISITKLEDLKALTSIILTGADFFIADPGVVVFIDYNQNLQVALSKARCIIAMATINDVLPNLGDLNLFLPIKSSYTRGESINPSTSLVFGPRQADEKDGAQEVYFLIIDNDRTNLLGDEKMRQTSWCINCNACRHVCPVNVSMGTVEGVYEGPISALQMPYLKDFEDLQHLSRATTLCGACAQVCPVYISLPKLFLHNRKKYAAIQLNPEKEKWFYMLWKKAMLKRDKFNFKVFKFDRLLIESVYEKIWGTRESIPPFAKKSFNELWKERV